MEFKRIPYGRGNYFVSTNGDIYNSENGIFLKKKIAKTGYEEVRLSDCGKDKSFLVHRLVANAFLRGEGDEVNHKNGIKNDNRVSNLEKCTRGQNLKHAYLAGLREDDVSPKEVIATNVETGEEMPFHSIYNAARFLGISQGNICMCCKGIRPMASGFYFRYGNGGENSGTSSD